MASAQFETWFGDVVSTATGQGMSSNTKWKFKFTIAPDGTIQGSGTEGASATQVAVAASKFSSNLVSAQVSVQGNYDAASNQVNLTFVTAQNVDSTQLSAPGVSEAGTSTEGQQGDQAVGMLKGIFGVADFNSVMDGTLGHIGVTDPDGSASAGWLLPNPVGPPPNFVVNPITKEEGASVTQTTSAAGITVATVTTIHQYLIQLQVDQTQLSPLGSPTATLTITVTKEGQPAPNVQVDYKVCTDVQPQTDGHLHDTRDDPCDQSRPAGMLNQSATYPGNKNTDGSGTVTLTYTPPSFPAASGTQYYISGTDHVTVWVDVSPSVKDEADIQTQVQGLAAMAAGSYYYFTTQSNHGNMFYGTAGTIAALQAIASAFHQQQLNCQSGGTYDGVTYNTPGTPLSLRITAMSLPWGGLNDIHGDWSTPHSSHNNGQVADIGWADFAQAGGGFDLQRVNLLRAIILDNGGSLPVTKEGGDIPTTVAQGSNAHFHVAFGS